MTTESKCNYQGCTLPPDEGCYGSCILHFGHPSKDPKLFEYKLQGKIQHEEREPGVVRIDLSGVIFPEINFREKVFKKAVTFAQAKFTKRVIFRDTKFEGKADFDGVQFEDAAVFMGAEFEHVSTFSNAKFGGSAEFGGSRPVRWCKSTSSC